MSIASIITLVTALLTLVVKIVEGIFSAKAEAKKLQKEFELDQKKFLEIADNSIQKLKQATKKDSEDAKNAEDKIDIIFRDGDF